MSLPRSSIEATPISRAMFGPEQRGFAFGLFTLSSVLVALSFPKEHRALFHHGPLSMSSLEASLAVVPS